MKDARRWNGSRADGGPDLVPVPSMPPSSLRHLSSDLVQMRYQRLVADFVGDELSRLSMHSFRLTIDTLRQMAEELDRAPFLDEVDRQFLATMKAKYLATMSGISNQAALTLYRSLEQLPDLASRQGFLDQLWDWLLTT